MNRFQDLKPTGNLNGEKAYRDFLKGYSLHALNWGYLQRYDNFKLEMPLGDYDKKYFGILKEYLGDCVRQVGRIVEEGLYPAQGRQELELVRKFFEKNIEAAESPSEAKQTRMSVTAAVGSEKKYTDEKIFEKLNRYAEGDPEEGETGQITEEEFTAMLEEYYSDGRLNLEEYRELLRKHRKNKCSKMH